MGIADRGPFRQFVGAEELGVAHAGGSAHALPHEIMESRAADPLDDQREYHVPAVAVGESLAGREPRGVSVEYRQILFRGRELVYRYRQHVVGDVKTGLLVEVVTDTRDRKSTRLNSSHVRISYAVFCLKKKK